MRHHLRNGLLLGSALTLLVAAAAGALLGEFAVCLVLTAAPGAVLLCAALAAFAARPAARLGPVLLAGVVAAFAAGPLAGLGLYVATGGDPAPNGAALGDTVHIALLGSALLSPALVVAGLAAGGVVWRLRPAAPPRAPVR